MKKSSLTLTWQGTFIELCMGRITPQQRSRIDAVLAASGGDWRSAWYENTFLLKSLFSADNWWSVDDLDHAMGLVFADRRDLEAKMSAIRYTVDGVPATVDPEALQLSFYTPELIDVPWEIDDRIVCHGTRRQATLVLSADYEAPFDPSLITLSFITYADYGSILIDVDYDGHDDVRFTWGETTYLEPKIVGKDTFDEASSETQR